MLASRLVQFTSLILPLLYLTHFHHLLLSYSLGVGLENALSYVPFGILNAKWGMTLMFPVCFKSRPRVELRLRIQRNIGWHSIKGNPCLFPCCSLQIGNIKYVRYSLVCTIFRQKQATNLFNLITVFVIFLEILMAIKQRINLSQRFAPLILSYTTIIMRGTPAPTANVSSNLNSKLNYVWTCNNMFPVLYPMKHHQRIVKIFVLDYIYCI